MLSRRLFGFALGWCLCVVPVVLGQEPGCQRRIIPFSVADQNGSPVRDLTAGDFQAEFRGKPVKIVFLTPDTRPHRVVILLDASGSMAGIGERRPWALALALAAHMAETRMRSTSVALLIFGDKVYEQHGFFENSEILVRRLHEIAASRAFVRGRTALLDTIMVALRLLAPARSDDVIYAITDGGESSSHIGQNEVKRALVSSDVRFYASIVASAFESEFTARTPEEFRGPSLLRELAADTGGFVFEPIPGSLNPALHKLDQEEQKALGKNLLSLYRLMLENYLLEVEISVPVDKWRRWKLEISKEKRRQLKDAIVTYPRELAPCSK